METRITIGNKTWIVPANAVGSLISWLSANAVEVGAPRRDIREVHGDAGADPRQLLVEQQ